MVLNALGSYAYVCMCVQVLFQTLYLGLVPGASQLRFISVQQISAFKYFSVVLQPPTVKLRGKSEPETQKPRKTSNCFSRCVWHQYSCHLFLHFSFVIFFSHLCFDRVRPQDKMRLFPLSKEMHLFQDILL